MHTIQLADVQTEEIWSSQSGGTTEEASVVTLAISGTPSESDLYRFAEDALTDSLGYLGNLLSRSIGNQRTTVYGSTLIDVTYRLQKEW